jgi:hypothetical protein
MYGCSFNTRQYDLDLQAGMNMDDLTEWHVELGTAWSNSASDLAVPASDQATLLTPISGDKP